MNSEFWNPRQWLPILRRFLVGERETLAGYRSREDVAFWCKAHFPEMQAIYHFLRIERRLGRSALRVKGHFELSEGGVDGKSREPGYYLMHGFKKRR